MVALKGPTIALQGLRDPLEKTEPLERTEPQARMHRAEARELV